MEMSDLSIRLENADKETIREILAGSESYLSAQLATAIASDQRAISMAGFLAAAIVVIAGGAISLILSNTPQYTFAVIGFLTAGSLFRSLHLAIISAKPARFEFVGNVASSWSEDLSDGRPLAKSLAEQCIQYEAQIHTNNRLMETNAASLNKAISWAYWTLASSGAAVVLAAAAKAVCWLP